MSAIVLFLHIVAGYLSLSAGALVIFMRKGHSGHVRLGRVFFYSMLVVSFTAFVLSLLRQKPFLLQLGLFVFYQVLAGFRSARLRNKVWKPGELWLSGLGLLNGLWMVASLFPVAMVFGGLSVFLALNDFRTVYRTAKGIVPSSMAWLRRHIGMMMGSFIGTFTAFLVVNISLPHYNWILWLAPTAALVPLMQYWSRKYTKVLPSSV